MQAPRHLLMMMGLVAVSAFFAVAPRAHAQSMQTAGQASVAAPLAESPRPALKMGVIPYLSPGTLIAEYAGLRDYLAAELKRPVVILTAPNLQQFTTRTGRRDFDIVLIAPHQLNSTMSVAYQPLMAVRADFYAHILVPARSSARNLRELVGGRMHTPPSTAFTSIAIDQFLSSLSYRLDRDFKSQRHNSENNALLAAARSNNDAVAASRAVVQRLPAEIRSKLKIIASTPAAVSMLLLSSPEMSNDDVTRLKAALAAFPYSQAGLTYTSQSSSYLFPATAELIASIRSDMAATEVEQGRQGKAGASR